jgi:PIN domain nuclease of toxin-antitoxin system
VEGDGVSYLLDTHAWKDLFQGAKLKAGAAVLAKPETPLHILDISIWEIAKAVETGTLALDRPVAQWLHDALSENVIVLSISPEIAALSCELVPKENFPRKDPAEQLITATARVHGLILVTQDSAIRKWGKVTTLAY